MASGGTACARPGPDEFRIVSIVGGVMRTLIVYEFVALVGAMQAAWALVETHAFPFGVRVDTYQA